jgi:hypothetical protein
VAHAAAGGIFYAGTLLLLKTFRPEEIRFFRDFIDPRNLVKRAAPPKDDEQ